MTTCCEEYVAKLDEKNLRYQREDANDGGDLIRIGFNNTRIVLHFPGSDDGRHMALRCVIEHCPDDKIADLLVVCNALNAKVRWIKFYIDSDGDIMAEDDAILSPGTAGEEAFELMGRTVAIVDTSKPAIMRALYV